MSTGTLSADGQFMEYPCGCRVCQNWVDDEDEDDIHCPDGCPGGCAHCGQMGPQEHHKPREEG